MAHAQQPPTDERSLGRLVADATQDVSTLVRGEIELAKLEVKESASRAAAASVMFVVAGTFAFLALILLLIAAAYGLVAAGVWPWLAFLIVALVVLLIGVLLGFLGYRKVRKIGKPERTIDNGRAAVRALRPRR